MALDIIEYSATHKNECVLLLDELQAHLVSVDNEHVQIMTPCYSSAYIDFVISDVIDNNGKILLAIADGSVVGFAAGIIERKDTIDVLTTRCPVRGVITELVVSSLYRRKGIGKLLLHRMEEYFSKCDCRFVTIDVFAPNKDALNFYEGDGYFHRNIEVCKRLSLIPGGE